MGHSAGDQTSGLIMFGASTLRASRMASALLAQNGLREATDVVVASLVMPVFKSPVTAMTVDVIITGL